MMRSRGHIRFRFGARWGAGLVLLLSIGAATCAWQEEWPVDEQAGEGIPIRFTLDAPGYVTLVLEDGEGRRVRNLTANAYYEAGAHTVYWDGYDIGEAINYRPVGVGGHYDIARRRAAPGVYRVCGLRHDGITMRYQMPVQSPGTPPWHTEDGAGAWLSDHTPPMDALWLPGGSPYAPQPQVMVSARVAESGHGLMWLDRDGRKITGKRLGWRGAHALARDPGPEADPDVFAYAVSVRHGKLTLFAHRHDDTRQPRFQQTLDDPRYDREPGLALAVYNRIAVISFPHDGHLAFIDLSRKKGRVLGTATASRPKGLLADEDGRLFVSEERTVERYDDVAWRQARLGPERTVIATHLENPRRLTRDAGDTLYVSDWGRSHQVKVFAPDGRWIRSVGAPGGPQHGRYDARRMHHPNGLAVDDRGQLWVAEWDYAPKRLSLWSTGGALIRAFYGPPRYGGGGMIDPADSTRFYYAVGVKRINAGIAFTLDWETGRATPHSIYRREPGSEAEATLPYEAPIQPIRRDGRTYLVNTFNQASHGMRSLVGIWLWDEAAASVRLVAVVGFHGGNKNHRWTALDEPALAAHRPAGVARKNLFYAWSDGNGDGAVQAEEVQYTVAARGQGRVFVGDDLAVMTSGLQQLDAPRIGPDGVPRYEAGTWRSVADAPRKGIGDVLPVDDDWVIAAGGPIRGYFRGRLRWRYHSPFFNRGHAPIPPREPGALIETSRVLGLPVHPPAGEASAVWALNGDKGSIYLFTADGLLLQTLGGDLRTTPLLRRPDAQRGQRLDGFSFDEELFWPTLTQLDSGSIFLAAGREHSSLFHLEGFETVERRDFGVVTVTEAMLEALPPTRREIAPPPKRR